MVGLNLRHFIQGYTLDTMAKPFVIGITGNIASGKSVVRSFLANMGAYSIDADLTAQDAYLPGSPAWRAILEAFGEDLQLNDGQINRGKLGQIVFSDPQRMRQLEEIVHPLVTESILNQLKTCQRKIFVVEAIKLIESEIAERCDQIWTIAADEQVRFRRLVENRGYSEEHAWAKIRAQSPEADKIAASDQVIRSDEGFQNSYQQTLTALAANHLPLTRVVAMDEFSLVSLNEAIFPWLEQALIKQTGETWDDERVLQLLGSKLLPTVQNPQSPLQCLRLSTRQTLALLTNQFPHKSEQPENSTVLELLQSWLGGAYELLIMPKIALTAKEAWQSGFLPGEDAARFHPKFSFESFLKTRGLMPGEVWIKPLKANTENRP